MKWNEQVDTAHVAEHEVARNGCKIVAALLGTYFFIGLIQWFNSFFSFIVVYHFEGHLEWFIFSLYSFGAAVAIDSTTG